MFVTLWLSQQELCSLPGLSDHGAEPGARGAQQPLPADVLPLHGSWKHSQEWRWHGTAASCSEAPLGASSTARGCPSIWWCQKNLPSYREINPKSLFAKAGPSGTAGSCSLSETPGVSRNRSHSCGTGMVPEVLAWSSKYLFTACKKQPPCPLPPPR